MLDYNRDIMNRNTLFLLFTSVYLLLLNCQISQSPNLLTTKDSQPEQPQTERPVSLPSRKMSETATNEINSAETKVNLPIMASSSMPVESKKTLVIQKISISPGQQTIAEKGQSVNFWVTIQDTSGQFYNLNQWLNACSNSAIKTCVCQEFQLEWSSEQPEVFEVDKDGQVTALKDSGFGAILVKESCSGLESKASISMEFSKGEVSKDTSASSTPRRSGGGGGGLPPINNIVPAAPADPALPLPLLSSITPEKGFESQKISILGQNFPQSVQVRVGNMLINNVQILNSETIQVEVPSNLAPGKYDIVVDIDNHSPLQLPQAFERLVSSSLALTSPQCGTSYATRTLTLQGDNFETGMIVKINNQSVNATVINAKQLEAEVPVGLSEGQYDLEVIYPNQLVEVLDNAYQVKDPDTFDFNGDGISDVLISAHFNDDTNNSVNNSGAVYLFYGRENFPTTFNAAQADVIFRGEETDSHFGKFIAGVQDLNGDGFDDILIGAALKDQEINSVMESNVGAVYIFLGSTTPAAEKLASQADVILSGQMANEWFGYSVGGLGDINGDGLGDFIIGAIGAYPINDPLLRAGRAYVYYGSNSLPPALNAAQADIVFTGQADRHHLGNYVSGSVDFNHDGLDDIVIAEEMNDSLSASDAGAVYLFFGSQSFSNSYSPTQADVIFHGSLGGDFFGSSVEKAGDINGDGIDDLIIGARYRDDAAFGSGAAYVYFGSETPQNTYTISDAMLTFIGQTDNDYLGNDVAQAGDFDGDCRDDLLIAAYNNDNIANGTGSVYLFNRLMTFPRTISANDAAITFQGQAENNWFGQSVTGGKDLNRDGYPDVMIGAYHNDSNGNRAGSAYLFLGNHTLSGTLNYSLANTAFRGESSEDWFGYSVHNN